MDKSLLGHSAVALATTLAAYAAWSAPSITEDEDTVIAVAGTPERLKSIHWHDAQSDVVVARDGDNITVTTTRLMPPAPPQTYPGSEQAKELFNRLAPLRAARNLGTMSAERLKTFGLDAPKTKLTLTFGDDNKIMEIGSSTYGSGDLYSRTADGTVYLLRSSSVSNLNHGAIALQDRDAVGVPRPKIERVIISAGAKRRELTQRHADDPAKAFFADPADPDRKLETATGWVERVLRLRVADLEQDAPQGEPAVVVEFIKDKESLATVRLFASSDSKAVAQVSRFKSPVGLGKASVESILHELDSVMSEGK